MKKKHVLGIFIDGQLMKMALLSQEESGIIIEALETAKLVERLDLPGEVVDNPEDVLSSDGDKNEPSPFDFDADDDQKRETLEVEGAATNFDVFMDVLSKMCPKNCSLALNLLDSAVLYKDFTDLGQKNKKKTKREILTLFTEDRVPDHSLDTIDYITRTDGTHLGILHDDPFEMIRLLDDIQRFTRQRPPQVSLVDTVELAIAGAIRSNYELGEEESTAVVMIGNSYSKVFFMRGMEIGTIIPTINEGSSSPTVCETIFSKLLFELDSKNIKSIDRFILVGDIARVDAENYFQGRFQKCEIERLRFYDLQLSEEIQDLAPEEVVYAPAIALAFKALNPKSASQYGSNLLPDKLREKQSMYRISWHGTVMLVVLFLCVLFLTYESAQKGQAIRLARHSLNDMNAEIDRLANVKAEVDSMQLAINNLEQSTAILDSLSSSTIRWSPMLERLSEAYNMIGGFRLVKINNSAANVLTVEAESNNREKVADLERFMSNSNLQSVIRVNDEGNNYLLVTMSTEVKGEIK